MVASAGFNSIKRVTEVSDKRFVSSCNDCGLCEAVCTEQINVGKFLMETRKILHKQGNLPPAFHEFWIRDMLFAQSEEAYIAKNAFGCDRSAYAFFPGCQSGASDPGYVTEPYAYLLKRNPQTGLLLGCCGAPARWAGDDAMTAETIARIRRSWADMGNPQVIFACPTCEKMFAEYLPEIDRISLYTVIDEQGLPENHVAGDSRVSIFDPCSGRYDQSMQQSVRSLIKKAGYELEELPYREKTAQCCGYGGQIYSTNPELAEYIARRKVELGEYPYITYCTNCRDIFADQGKSCRHVLDVLFGMNDGMRKPPSLTERRRNRTVLKSTLLKNFWHEENYSMEEEEFGILISPELLEKLNKRLIIEDDIRNVIKYCESSNDKLFDSKTGNYVGHLKQGVLTFWVTYNVEGNKYRVVSAYSHRLVIEGE
jgi:Fe-S oxidoreductase